MYLIKFRMNCECECGCTEDEDVIVSVFETKEVMETLDYIEKNGATLVSVTEEDLHYGLDSLKECIEEMNKEIKE
jgi:hypothetical protein